MHDLSLKEIVHRFTYHPPQQDQIPIFEDLRNQCQSLALVIYSNCPASRELDEAIKAVELANMWANAAVSRRSEPKDLL